MYWTYTPATTGATAVVTKPVIVGTVAQDVALQVGQEGDAGKVPPLPQVNRNWLLDTPVAVTLTRVNPVVQV